MAKHDWKKGSPLEEKIQIQLRTLIRQVGKDKAAAMLDVGAASVVHAAAGLGVRRGTAFMIETKMASLARSEPTEAHNVQIEKHAVAQ